jgi:hypothetical protein
MPQILTQPKIKFKFVQRNIIKVFFLITYVYVAALIGELVVLQLKEIVSTGG